LYDIFLFQVSFDPAFLASILHLRFRLISDILIYDWVRGKKVTNIFKLQCSRKYDNNSVYLCMYRGTWYYRTRI